MSDDKKPSENMSNTDDVIDESGNPSKDYDAVLSIVFDEEDDDEQENVSVHAQSNNNEIDLSKNENVFLFSTIETPIIEKPEPTPVIKPIKQPEKSQKSYKPENKQIEHSKSPVQINNQTNTKHKIGIVGGAGVGKTYLFHALAYLAIDTSKLGSLAYYFDRERVTLKRSFDLSSASHDYNLVNFTEQYRTWKKLPRNPVGGELWYWLNFPYRTGFNRSKMLEIEFLDAAGETLEQERIPEDKKERYRLAYTDAKVMVFCLPLWVAFPIEDLTEEDEKERGDILRGFHFLVDNYRALFAKNDKRLQKVRTVLALTMADDPRCRLTHLRMNWIDPLANKNSREHIQKELSNALGIATYIANARKVSETLLTEFDNQQIDVSGIINSLTIGKHKPWLIPMSAIDGDGLNASEHYKKNNPPQPAHVDLLLLVALCAYENALM